MMVLYVSTSLGIENCEVCYSVKRLQTAVEMCCKRSMSKNIRLSPERDNYVMISVLVVLSHHYVMDLLQPCAGVSVFA
jgi:hypothetical protein